MVEFDPLIDSPRQEVTTGQFAIIIQANPLRPAAIGDYRI
jgi:hypothetical protein